MLASRVLHWERSQNSQFVSLGRATFAPPPPPLPPPPDMDARVRREACACGRVVPVPEEPRDCARVLRLHSGPPAPRDHPRAQWGRCVDGGVWRRMLRPGQGPLRPALLMARAQTRAQSPRSSPPGTRSRWTRAKARGRRSPSSVSSTCGGHPVSVTQTNKQTNKQTTQTNKQTNKQKNKKTNKKTNKQTHKQSNKQTNKKCTSCGIQTRNKAPRLRLSLISNTRRKCALAQSHHVTRATST